MPKTKKKPDTIHSLRKQVKELAHSLETTTACLSEANSKLYDQSRKLEDYAQQELHLQETAKQVDRLLRSITDIIEAEYVSAHSELDLDSWHRAINENPGFEHPPVEVFRVPKKDRQAQFIHHLREKLNNFQFDIL